MTRKIGREADITTAVALLLIDDHQLYAPSDVARAVIDQNLFPERYRRLRLTLGAFSRYHGIGDLFENRGTNGKLLGPHKKWYGKTWKENLSKEEAARAQTLLDHLIPRHGNSKAIMQQIFDLQELGDINRPGLILAQAKQILPEKEQKNQKAEAPKPKIKPFLIPLLILALIFGYFSAQPRAPKPISLEPIDAALLHELFFGKEIKATAKPIHFRQ